MAWADPADRHREGAAPPGRSAAPESPAAPRARSDFNGDGFSDLAIGVPWEEIGSVQQAGGVNVIYGSDNGLSATAVPDDFWSQDSDEVQDGSELNDQFGTAVAAGDFNGDGFADLAVGSPFDDVGSIRSAGQVNVIYGSPNGLSPTAGRPDQLWDQNNDGVDGKAENYDLFGSSVAAGNFNGDRFADLAVHSKEMIDQKVDAGAVNVIYGSAEGLTDAGNQFWSQDSSGIEGRSEELDFFGVAVAAGDFDGNGFSDLAVGAFRENIESGTTFTDAGSVSVIYGTADGLASAGDQQWDQDSDGVQNSVSSYDVFGWAVYAANFGKGPEADLAIGAVLENSNGVLDAGGVNVIYGSPSKLHSSGNQFWSQDSTDIQDTAEIGDELGWSLG